MFSLLNYKVKKKYYKMSSVYITKKLFAKHLRAVSMSVEGIQLRPRPVYKYLPQYCTSADTLNYYPQMLNRIAYMR